MNRSGGRLRRLLGRVFGGLAVAGYWERRARRAEGEAAEALLAADAAIAPARHLQEELDACRAQATALAYEIERIKGTVRVPVEMAAV